MADLRRANESIKWIGILAALAMLALGVLIDAKLFRRRGRPIGGFSDDRSWWQRVIVVLIWPALVGGMLILALPAYGYFRAKAATQLRHADVRSRSPLFGLVATFIGTVIWVGVTVTVMYGGTRLLPNTSFVTNDSTDQDAIDWARSQGRELHVICNRSAILHVGDSFTCNSFDTSTQSTVRIIGTVADDSGRTEWRFGA